jgi:hypothetical protein
MEKDTKVIVRSTVTGVHAGILESFDPKTCTVTLKTLTGYGAFIRAIYPAAFRMLPPTASSQTPSISSE